MEADLAVLDQLQAEYQQLMENGWHEYTEGCPCSQCRGMDDERDAANREYERMTS